MNGLYQNQSNEREAERVVDYLAELWSQPYAARPSVGVVTFNRKQADLIEERLELRAEQDETFRAACSEERERSEDGEDMGVFVKNVENVQGDERDVIVFSSTFGRNGQGSFRRNFRRARADRRRAPPQRGGDPRAAQGGDDHPRCRSATSPTCSAPSARRAARATTCKATWNTPAHCPPAEFAGTGQLLERLQTDRSDQRRQHHQRHDGFSEIVGEYIRSLGWSAAPAGEGDAFGLDFAIENPATGLYAIGIRMRRPLPPAAGTRPRREIWRPSVLRRAIRTSTGFPPRAGTTTATTNAHGCAPPSKALAPSAEIHPTAAAEASQ